MSGRVLAGLIAAFWVAMMGALVRLEFFPEPAPISNVSSERVLARIFANPEPGQLNVFYQGAEIGFCKVEVLRLPDVATAAGATNHAYQVHSDLRLKLSVFGMPSQLRLESETFFNRQYQVEDFGIVTMIGDSRLEVAGDAARRKVSVRFALGERIERREFDFAQVEGGGFASALGLPGLANFSFLGGGGMPTAFRRSRSGAAAPASTTITYLDKLRVGDAAMRAYVIESRLDQTMWAKIWVSELGEVLQVETSMGLSMLANVLTRPADSARHQVRHDPD